MFRKTPSTRLIATIYTIFVILGFIALAADTLAPGIWFSAMIVTTTALVVFMAHQENPS